MAVYSFYIFDRHTECIYTKQWLPTPTSSGGVAMPPTTALAAAPTTTVPGGAVAAGNVAPAVTGIDGPGLTTMGRSGRDSRKDDAKLIFGSVFSLRNMVRKLGGDDDAFIAFRTAQYKLHFYETPTSLRFVLLTDTASMSMRNVLHQIYINLWVEYVVKNPLAPVEHPGGDGVRNELFELGLDQFVRGLM